LDDQSFFYVYPQQLIGRAGAVLHFIWIKGFGFKSYLEERLSVMSDAGVILLARLSFCCEMSFSLINSTA
jgi:hypothetical protein